MAEKPIESLSDDGQYRVGSRFLSGKAIREALERLELLTGKDSLAVFDESGMSSVSKSRIEVLLAAARDECLLLATSYTARDSLRSTFGHLACFFDLDVDWGVKADPSPAGKRKPKGYEKNKLIAEIVAMIRRWSPPEGVTVGGISLTKYKPRCLLVTLDCGDKYGRLSVPTCFRYDAKAEAGWHLALTDAALRLRTLNGHSDDPFIQTAIDLVIELVEVQEQDYGIEHKEARAWLEEAAKR